MGKKNTSFVSSFRLFPEVEIIMKDDFKDEFRLGLMKRKFQRKMAEEKKQVEERQKKRPVKKVQVGDKESHGNIVRSFKAERIALALRAKFGLCPI